ncbi:MAG: adenylate/guanylate cyclase domain-containing protein [Anaerolineae bacterium]|nr:adenylate/guanylate cyclase domain-containing protein [Anaerolineae bacterium]
MMGLPTRIRNFFTPPAHLSHEQERYFVLLTVACSIAFLAHALYALLFYWMGLDLLTIHSIIALFMWAVAVWLGRRRLSQVSISIAGVELVIYVALGTHYIGWDSGVHYLLFCAGVAFFVSYNQPIFKLFWAAAFSIEYILLYFVSDKIVWTGNPAVVNLLWLVNVIMAFGIIFLLVWYQITLVKNAEQAMDKALAQSESLLNNVMPPVIAERLKQSEAVIADSFPEASILFADIVNFTPLSQNMTPAEVVQLLDDLFSRIDVIVRKHQLEKIKTIGDAYMVAAGVPVRRSDHAEAIVAFAFDLQKTLVAYNTETGRNLQFRIGINSGPVVAGVIGKLRFLYDLWGDSVNTASRMESHGIPDEIQVTEETRNLLIDKYAFEDRGVIEVKGKGQMRTYFLRGCKESTASLGEISHSSYMPASDTG